MQNTPSFSYNSYIFKIKIDFYIKFLPKKSASSPFGIPRSNFSASMRALGRKKLDLLVFDMDRDN